MDSKYRNLGLNNGLPPSTLTDEEALALWKENRANHPPTRISVAEKVLSARKNQAQAESGQAPTDYGNLGFHSGPVTSTLTGEEELALWRENGRNRPVAGVDPVEQILSYQQAMASQLPGKDEPSKGD